MFLRLSQSLSLCRTALPLTARSVFTRRAFSSSPPSLKDRLKDKVAIVTGAASGIGRNIALHYGLEGAHVVCADVRDSSRNPNESDITTHDLITRDGPGSAIFTKVDMRKAAEVEAMVSTAVQKFGRLDIIVNNAGIAIEADRPQPIWEFKEEDWDLEMSINSTGVFLGCKYAAAQMVKQKPLQSGYGGAIINMSSILGLQAVRKNAAYNAGKHAVIGLTKTAALDLAPYNVKVNAICPGYTYSAMTKGPLGDEGNRKRLEGLHPLRLGQTEDFGQVAVFLASEENTWITGVGLPVDGGYSAQ